MPAPASPVRPLPPGVLTLDLEYRSDTRWRWVLSDAAGRFIADHEVALDVGDARYRGFLDLPAYLHFLQPARDATAALADLGDWIGTHVFGAVGAALLRARPNPVCVVRVRVPAAAQSLLFRPFELARLEGRTLAERGLRLVYTVADGESSAGGLETFPDAASDDALRLLAVFSLPTGASPLGLRQERVALERLVRTFGATRGCAVELRVLQYGATRDELAAVLEEYPGWDLLHFSGHGLAGELVLEAADGTADRIGAEELVELLQMTHGRLKLVTLSACYSGAADLPRARAALGLEAPPTRSRDAAAPAVEDVVAVPAGPAQTALPSLGQRLAEALDCAVVAMRYPVLDRFAADLVLSLYKRLLDKGQPLPGALQLAAADVLDGAPDAVAGDSAALESALSHIAPLLFGARAVALRLRAPALPGGSVFALPSTGLSHFPDPPTHFVGRLGPMLRARRALAPESGLTAVVFHGMAGAGKTACARELAHRYAPQYTRRFQGFAWYRAPDEGADVAGALVAFATALERQLPKLELVGMVDDPATFEQVALPQLRTLMRDQPILLVLDNVEGLLTSDGGWRDARWGALLAALTDHSGLGRVVLTSRRLPTTLAEAPRVSREAIYALSLPESVVLARELEHLRALFADESGRAALRQLLDAAQGHPKLIELADGLAADSETLAAHLRRLAPEAGDATGVPTEGATSRFFTTGETDRPEDTFVRTLHAWTAAAVAGLSPTARLLAATLARLEEEDRTEDVLDGNWKDLLDRLTGTRGGEPAPEPARGWAEAALHEPTYGLTDALRDLERAAVLELTTSIDERLDQLTPDDLLTLVPLVAAQDATVAAALAEAGAVAPDDERAIDRAKVVLRAIAGQEIMAAVAAALAAPGGALAAWLATRRHEITRWAARIHPGVVDALLADALAGVATAVDREAADYWMFRFELGLQTEAAGGGPLVVQGARRALPYLLRAGRWQDASTAAEYLVMRDRAPGTIAFALPVLRRVAESTQGTPRELIDAGVLARMTINAGRVAEGKAVLRHLIARAVAQNDYRLASVAAGDLFNLLRDLGRYEEMLKLVDEKSTYTRLAGLGPWTQLADETRRLQLLTEIGRYDEVTEAVERIRKQFDSLDVGADEERAPETVDPFRVREVMLDTGRSAALAQDHWEAALTLNADVVASKRRRGADALELARTSFNDYAPLLRLGRFEECRALLARCREVFEREAAHVELGAVYAALADLEDEEGRPALAADFARVALRFNYQTASPEECAIGHNNLAGYLRKSGGTPEAVLAHALATVLIRLQTGSGTFISSLRNLAVLVMPPSPPTFAAVEAEVQRVPGVRFGALFEALPSRFPSGDAALEQVLSLASDERARQLAERTAREAALAQLPPGARDAVQANDPGALIAVLLALQPDERAAAEQTLAIAGIPISAEVEQATQRALAKALAHFEPVLLSIAIAARGDTAARSEVEALLARVEEGGWHIAEAVQRIWAGERDAAALTTGLDVPDSALIRRVLELLQ